MLKLKMFFLYDFQQSIYFEFTRVRILVVGLNVSVILIILSDTGPEVSEAFLSVKDRFVSNLMTKTVKIYQL